MRPPLRPGAIRMPHASRLDPTTRSFGVILERHGEAIEAGRPTYVDPGTGLSVMTAAALVERGWCCDTGCRHCPYVGTTDKVEWRKWARHTADGIGWTTISGAVVAALEGPLTRIEGFVLLYSPLPGEVDVG